LDGNGFAHRRYVWDPVTGGLLSDERASAITGEFYGIYWAANDHLGTVGQLLDEQAAIAEHREYDSFGAIDAVFSSMGGSRPVALMFNEAAHAGRLWDHEADLYYNNARWYDPHAGRFLGEDPAEDGGNWYRYAGNDPINFRDPTGLSQAGNPLNGLFGGYSGNLVERENTALRTIGNAFNNLGGAIAGVSNSLGRAIYSGVSSLASTLGPVRSATPLPIRSGTNAKLGQFDLEGGTLRQAQQALSLANQLNDVQRRTVEVERVLERTAGLPNFSRLASNQYSALQAEARAIRGEFSQKKLNSVALTLPSNQGSYGDFPIKRGIESIALATNFSNIQSYDLGIPGVNLAGPSEGLRPSASPFDFLAAGAPGVLRGSLGVALLDIGDETLSTATGLPVTIPRSAGVRYVLEGRPQPQSTRQLLAQNYEDSLIGASSDIATRRRIVPALEYANPNLRGKPFVRFDAPDPTNPFTLVDRKLNVTTHSGQLDQLRRQANALSQNPGYSLRIEVPDRTAARAARNAIQRADLPVGTPIQVHVVPLR
jgi:RHS repeat-associated protein